MKYFSPPDGEYLAALSAALDYEKHNALVRELEAKTAAGKPDRMRMHAGFNSRFLLLDKPSAKRGACRRNSTAGSWRTTASRFCRRICTNNSFCPAISAWWTNCSPKTARPISTFTATPRDGKIRQIRRGLT